MKIISIIPARGGSKRIPRKNLQPIGGKPMLVHSINAANNSKLVQRCVVSTDDQEIISVANEAGAEVIIRPPELSGDIIMPDAAIIHVLDYLVKTENYEPDIVVFLQPTSPLRIANDIDAAINLFINESADSLLSVSASHAFTWRIENDIAYPLNYDYMDRPRTQDAPQDHVENGALYIFKPAIIIKYGQRLGGKIIAYKMSPLNSVDVDDFNDLKLVDIIYSANKKH